MLHYFKPSDAGCYADGAFGHQHVRERLAHEVEALARRTFKIDEHADLIAELRADMSDDASEEEHAIGLLNNYCADGCHFEFVDGDLMLVVDGDDEARDLLSQPFGGRERLSDCDVLGDIEDLPENGGDG